MIGNYVSEYDLIQDCEPGLSYGGNGLIDLIVDLILR